VIGPIAAPSEYPMNKSEALSEMTIVASLVPDGPISLACWAGKNVQLAKPQRECE
jgi:hypothetical protein